MKKRWIAVLLAATLVTGLAGCGGSGQESTQPAETETESGVSEEGEEPEATPSPAPTPTEMPEPEEEPVVLTAGFSAAPDSLDPALTGSRAGMTLAVNSFAGLYTLQEGGEIVPALAQDMPKISDDGKVYTIRLKKTTWSDGSKLTAADFVYSWNRAAREATGAPYGHLLRDTIARNDDGSLMVEAASDYKLVVTLAQPAPYFTELMTMPVFFPVPQAAVEAADPEGADPGAWTAGDAFISNGAFCFAGENGDEKLRYRKNDAFYDVEAVRADELEVVISKDDGYTNDAFDSGELDYVDLVPASRDQAAADVHTVTGSGTYYLLFNPSSDFFVGRSPWQAMTIRKAISMLIDRPSVAAAAGAGNQPADSLIPPGMSNGNGSPYKDETVSYLDASQADVAQAKGLLEGCGFRFTENEDKTYTVDPAITIPFLTTESEGHMAVAESLREDLAVLGIQLVVDSRPWDEYYAALMSGNYVLAREGWPAEFNDPISLLGRFASDSSESGLTLGKITAPQTQDWTGYNNLMKEIREATDPAARADKLRQAERTLMDTWCVVPVYYYSVRYLLQPEVEGVWCDAFGRARF